VESYTIEGDSPVSNNYYHFKNIVYEYHGTSILWEDRGTTL